jgi:FkbM family methyltransferase
MDHAKQMLKRCGNAILEPFGFEIRRKPVATERLRHTMCGALEHIKRLDFHPKTIIDVGAAFGTEPLYTVFPIAKHVLVEPLEEFKPALDRLVTRFSHVGLEYIVAAGAEKSGTATLHVHPDLDGSSLYLEDEDSEVNGVPRLVPAVTLDQVCGERNLEGPFLVKVDVQGAELDVLKGGIETLKRTEYVVLEAVFFQVFINGPSFAEIIAFMKQQGFVVYEFFDPLYRPLDGAMSQIDIAFVKESGRFRKYHAYATREQRAAQNKAKHEGLGSLKLTGGS